MFRLALPLLLAQSAIAAEPICPAETHPEWAKASAVRKRDLLRECHPLVPERQPEVAAEQPSPDRGSAFGPGPIFSVRTRRSAQLLIGTLATTVAFGALFAGGFTQVGGLAYAGAGVAALSIAPLVMLMGWGEQHPPWGLTLLGTVVGMIATVGAIALGVVIGWHGDTVNMGSIIGGAIGLVLTLPLPAIGAVIGYEAGLKTTSPPQVALVPLNGGMMAALSTRF